MLLCHYGFSLYLVKRFGYLGAALATSCSGCITLVFGSLTVWLVGAGPTIWGGRQGAFGWWIFQRNFVGISMFFLKVCLYAPVCIYVYIYIQILEIEY